VDRVAQPGDIVDAEIETVDLHGRRIKGTKKEKVTLEVDSPGLLPEFREAAQEATAGDVREFEVHYADDYQAEQLRGQTRRYRMRVAQIREKKIPPLDDQFAERVSPGSDLEGLRARARLRLESEARMAARERLEEALVDRLIQENPFELPESVVATSLERLRKRFEEEGRRMEPAELPSARGLVSMRRKWRKRSLAWRGVSADRWRRCERIWGISNDSATSSSSGRFSTRC